MRISSAAAAAIIAVALPAGAYAPAFAEASAGQAPVDPRPANNPEQKPAMAGQTDAPEKKAGVAFDVVTVVEGLQNPWAVAFLPGGKMLITERPGRLRVLSTDGKLSAPVTGLPAVDARGQGGLLDVALDPAFAKNGHIYWSYAEPAAAQGVNNTAVAKGKFVDDATAPRVEEVQVIYHQRPSLRSPLHFGSRLVFGRDGTLFITQGDRSITEGRMQSQKMD
ncbi:MAG: PQQ-dependent sugar dehydrogenase, partial [Vicinamibacterales bacterium]